MCFDRYGYQNQYHINLKNMDYHIKNEKYNIALHYLLLF